MSFSLEDVREQLKKLGYANVPDVVIDKFMARMKQKAAGEGEQQQQQQQQTQQSSGGYFAPATLPPPVTHTSSLSSLPVNAAHYSSLAAPLERHAPSSNLPLPLSLRTNPAFIAQQSHYLPGPALSAQAEQDKTAGVRAYQAALAQQAAQQASSAARAGSSSSPKKHSTVTVEDAAGSDEDDDSYRRTEKDDAYYRAKNREIEALEARLQRHAAVAHSQTNISRGQMPAAPVPAPAAKENANAEYRRSPSSSSQRPAPGSARRAFGSSAHTNSTGALGGVTVHASFPSKPVLKLRPSSAQQQLSGSQSARTLHSAAPSAQQHPTPRSILRPSTAGASRSSSRQSATESADDFDDAGAYGYPRDREEKEEAVLQVENIDTQRSLRKTYANSVESQWGGGLDMRADSGLRVFEVGWGLRSHFVSLPACDFAQSSSV